MAKVNTTSRSSKWSLSGKNFKLPLFLRRRLQHRRDPEGQQTQYLDVTSPSRKELHLRGIFERFDANGDGKISSEEIREFFASTGDDVSAEEVEMAVGNLLEYNDFVKLVETEEEADIQRAFDMFVLDKGSECITPDGLRAALRRLGEPKTHEECMRMIRAYDVDGNGVIDYQEFHRMMTCAA